MDASEIFEIENKKFGEKYTGIPVEHEAALFSASMIYGACLLVSKLDEIKIVLERIEKGVE